MLELVLTIKTDDATMHNGRYLDSRSVAVIKLRRLNFGDAAESEHTEKTRDLGIVSCVALNAFAA
jgi:hypothetical protein